MDFPRAEGKSEFSSHRYRILKINII
jgi:hypothetical protein